MYLWLFSCHAAHLLGVQLHGVVAKLSLCCRLQIMTSHWQVAVSLYPSDTRKNQVIKMMSLSLTRYDFNGARGSQTVSSPCGWLDWPCTLPGCPSGNRSPCACSVRGGRRESRQKALNKGRGEKVNTAATAADMIVLQKQLTSQRSLHCR